MGRNKQAHNLENLDDRLLLDLVCIAFAKAGKDFDAQSDIKSLADLPKGILEEIVNIQVQFRRYGQNDDGGQPVIEVLHIFKFHEIDILKELERRGNRAGVFTKYTRLLQSKRINTKFIC